MRASLLPLFYGRSRVLERRREHAVVRREGEGREDHSLDVPPLARVVLRRRRHREDALREEDEVLRVLVALLRQLVDARRLLQLRLQEGARVEGGVVGGAIGIIPVNFCPFCLSGILDMAQQMLGVDDES